MKRSAFSLIELILAIVIISISVMTVPLMLSQGAQNNTFSMMQESILAGRTKMGNILSYAWDDNAIETNSTVVDVLDVKAGDSELDRNASTLNANRRIGHIPEDLRRHMMSENNATQRTYPSPNVDVNITDINDYDDKNATMLADNAGGATDNFDYLDKNLSLQTKVYYIDDKTDYNKSIVRFDFDANSKKTIRDINNSTNIKMIELNVTSQTYQPFIFRTFSCNIGQSHYLKKAVN